MISWTYRISRSSQIVCDQDSGELVTLSGLGQLWTGPYRLSIVPLSAESPVPWFQLHVRSVWSALGLSVAILVAPEVPKLAQRYNPFYPLAERLKKEKPHPEDDPIKTD